MEAKVPQGINDRDFVIVFNDVLGSDPAFVLLFSRLDSVIEHNVSIQVLIDAKRSMINSLNELSIKLAPKLDLPVSATTDAIRSLAILWLGAIQVDLGPKLEKTELPEDIITAMDAFSSQNNFTTNAYRILSGIRLETCSPETAQ